MFQPLKMRFTEKNYILSAHTHINNLIRYLNISTESIWLYTDQSMKAKGI